MNYDYGRRSIFRSGEINGFSFNCVDFQVPVRIASGHIQWNVDQLNLQLKGNQDLGYRFESMGHEMGKEISP